MAPAAKARAKAPARRRLGAAGNGSSGAGSAQVPSVRSGPVVPRWGRTSQSGARSSASSIAAGSSQSVRSIPRSIHPHEALNHHSAGKHTGRTLAVPGAVGEGLTIDSIGRGAVTQTNAGGGYFLIVQWTTSGIRGMLMDGSTSNKVWVGVSGGSHPANATQLISANPLSVRPLRLAVRLRCVTKAQDVAGSIRVLVCGQPFQWIFSGSDLNVTEAMQDTVRDMMKSNAHVKSYTAQELTSTKEFVLPPASSVEQKDWHPYKLLGLTSGGAVVSSDSAIQTNLEESGNIAPMCTMVIEFPSVATTQQWEYTVFSQDFVRFPCDQWAASIQKPPPIVKDPSVYERGVQAAAQAAGTAQEPSGGGIM